MNTESTPSREEEFISENEKPKIRRVQLNLSQELQAEIEDYSPLQETPKSSESSETPENSETSETSQSPESLRSDVPDGARAVEPARENASAAVKPVFSNPIDSPSIGVKPVSVKPVPFASAKTVQLNDGGEDAEPDPFSFSQEEEAEEWMTEKSSANPVREDHQREDQLREDQQKADEEREPETSSADYETKRFSQAEMRQIQSGSWGKKPASDQMAAPFSAGETANLKGKKLTEIDQKESFRGAFETEKDNLNTPNTVDTEEKNTCPSREGEGKEDESPEAKLALAGFGASLGAGLKKCGSQIAKAAGIVWMWLKTAGRQIAAFFRALNKKLSEDLQKRRERRQQEQLAEDERHEAQRKLLEERSLNEIKENLSEISDRPSYPSYEADHMRENDPIHRDEENRDEFIPAARYFDEEARGAQEETWSGYYEEDVYADDFMPEEPADPEAYFRKNVREGDSSYTDYEAQDRAAYYADPRNLADESYLRNYAYEEPEDRTDSAYFEDFSKPTEEAPVYTEVGPDPTYEKKSQNALQRAWEWLYIRVRPGHLIAFLVILALIIVFSVVRNSGSPTKAFAQALNAKNYTEAAALHEKKYQNNQKLLKSAQFDFATYVGQIKKNAMDGETSYSNTTAALDVIKNSPLYVEPYKEILDKTNEELISLQQIDIIYNSAKEKQLNQDYRGSIAEFNQVIEKFPGYRDSANLLAKSRDRYREAIIKEVNTNQSQGKFKEAGALITDALTLIPDDPILKSMEKSNATRSVSTIYRDASDGAERYFQSGDFPNVLKVINEALAKDPADESLKQLKTDYETKCAEYIINAADNIFMQGDKEKALVKIAEGLKLLPDNKLLLEAKNRYSLPAVTKEGENQDPSKKKDTSGDLKDDLQRNTYTDAAGNQRENSVLEAYNFAGDPTVVKRVTFKNPGDGKRFKGELVLGNVDKYTQVYYQVYSSQNMGKAVKSGTLYGNEGVSQESTYKTEIDVPADGAEFFIVTLNYLRGGKIEVILDLRYTK